MATSLMFEAFGQSGVYSAESAKLVHMPSAPQLSFVLAAALYSVQVDAL